ncbi:UDP-glycosyltransferase 90A1 [Forsythia ovata]|uniref:UDP-glycosyltransferase 90A1 n=1 Tax=Forsythia ovata TaxID=205694 RepID=A0ABD1UWR1_9LAMI
METKIAMRNIYGLLEPSFTDYWNRESKPKAFFIGPLCLNRSPKLEPVLHQEYCRCIQLLDKKLRQGMPVLYVAFGSQAVISAEQLSEIARGLEESKVSFLWVAIKDGIQLGEKFEERNKERGMVVKELVDQKRILEHEIVLGFLSNCGWNSVLEKQHLNAKMLVEEIIIGLRVETVNGSSNGYVESKSLKNMVKVLIEGKMENQSKKKLKEVAEAARNSMKKGGSSWHTLNQLIKEIHLQHDTQKLIRVVTNRVFVKKKFIISVVTNRQ